MEWIFLKLLNMSVSAGWLILAVILVRPVLRKAPRRTVCLLWAVVGVRLVCPFSPESALSLIPSAQTLAPQTVQGAAAPVITSGVPFIDRAVNPVLSRAFAAAEASGAAAGANPMQVWLFAAGVVWALGTAVMLGCALIGCLRLRRALEEAVPDGENVWRCDAVSSPFILGVLRPGIYLPSALEGEELDYVLAHERAHLRRGDHLWKALGYLLLAVYWFNPLVWAAYILLCRDIELACDERVVRELDLAGRQGYSRALVSCSVRGGTAAVCPLAFGEVRVKERIRTVLRYKKPALWCAAAACAVCAAAAVCFLTDPVSPAQSGPGPARLDVPQDYSQMGHTPQPPDDPAAPEAPGAPAGPDYSGYDELIALAEAVLADRDAWDEAGERLSGVFYGHWDYETLGWLCADLDGDGVEELIFGANGDVWDGVIYNLYTLSDGAVVRVLDGWERSLYLLCENGRIANEWSNSAFDWGWSYYSYRDGQLILEESLAWYGEGRSEGWTHTAASGSGRVSETEARTIMAGYVPVALEFTPFRGA